MGKLKYLGLRKETYTRVGKKKIDVSVSPGDIITVDFELEQSLISTGLFSKEIMAKVKTKKNIGSED